MSAKHTSGDWIQNAIGGVIDTALKDAFKLGAEEGARQVVKLERQRDELLALLAHAPDWSTSYEAFKAWRSEVADAIAKVRGQ